MITPPPSGAHGWRGLVVDERSAGWRIDVYLARRFPAWSRTSIARYIKEGVILSEERRLKPSSTLNLGERIRLYVPGLAPATPPPPLPPVLYEDDRIIAFDKPAGLLMHPSGQTWAWALIGLARQARPGARLDLVHRLDRETSGAVVLTKDSEMNAFLKKAFHDHKAHKTYHALARGVVPWDKVEVDSPIGSALVSEVRLRQGVRPDGQTARTTFRALERLEGHTLVACHLHTGRTHQIRVHLEHLGFPLLGDKLYGQPDEVFLRYLDHGADEAVRAAVGFPRQALHAARLILPLPGGGELRLNAPLPADMAAILRGEPVAWPDAPEVEEIAGSGDDEEE